MINLHYPELSSTRESFPKFLTIGSEQNLFLYLATPLGITDDVMNHHFKDARSYINIIYFRLVLNFFVVPQFKKSENYCF